ncbi:MAG: hypothetical protein LKE40_08750 [Spirochaetia bacterium]|jgi:hypothetical protein|nr:hypothetical protein [Spirochaetia bacterium]
MERQSNRLIHERPQWIKDFKKPTGTEIKYINGHWYLYERTSYWDNEKKCSRKKSGKVLGKLTEQGLIPSKERNTTQNKGTLCLEFGATSFLFQQTRTTRKILSSFFPENWKEIYAIALIKAKENLPLDRIESRFSDCYLQYTFPRISLSTERIKSLIFELSARTGTISQYMAKEVESDLLLLKNKKKEVSNVPFEERKELEYVIKELEALLDPIKSEAEICSAYKWKLSDLDYSWLSDFDDIILDDQNLMDSTLNQKLVAHGILEDKLESTVQGIEIVLFFINFIAIKTVDSIINTLDDLNLLDQYPYPEFIWQLSTIRAVKANTKWKLSRIGKEAGILCNLLGFSPWL